VPDRESPARVPINQPPAGVTPSSCRCRRPPPPSPPHRRQWAPLTRCAKDGAAAELAVRASSTTVLVRTDPVEAVNAHRTPSSYRFAGQRQTLVTSRSARWNSVSKQNHLRQTRKPREAASTPRAPPGDGVRETGRGSPSEARTESSTRAGRVTAIPRDEPMARAPRRLAKKRAASASNAARSAWTLSACGRSLCSTEEAPFPVPHTRAFPWA